MENKRGVPLHWDIASRYRDEIYGLSILWVMLFHGFQCKVPRFFTKPGLAFLGDRIVLGNMGVDIFLLLSGIGLYFSYVKDPHPGRFYLKRLKRVWLPVFLVCGPYWIWQLTIHKIGAVRLLKNLLLLSFWTDGASQIWLVSLIALCYLLFPLMYATIHKKRAFSEVAAFLWIALAVFCCFFIKGHFRAFYKDTAIGLTRIPIFIMGVYLGQWVYQKKSAPGWMWLVLGLATIMALSVLDQDAVHGIWRRLIYFIPGFGLAFLLAGLISLYPQKHICALLRVLGKISLECYLIHIIFIRQYKKGMFLYDYVPGSRLRYLGLLAVTVVLAYLISRVEKLILNLIKKKEKQS